MFQPDNVRKGRAERVVLVSVPKSGTHLVSRLLEGLGYTLHWRLMHEVPEVTEPESWSRDLLEQPPGTCLIVHRLTPALLPWAFARDWHDGSSIRVLFHYRDPRDVVISGLHALLDPRRYSRNLTAQSFILAEMLAARTSLRERLDFLFEAPPGVAGAIDPMALFRKLTWLLLHPRVLSTRFEALIGPEGGGDAETQRREVERVAAHLGVDADPAAVAGGLFDPGSVTFRRGRIGQWRELFTPAQAAAFGERYGDILGRYGYA
jgi:hypothetical protein